MTTSKVYVMDNGDTRKIGISINPEQRAKQVTGAGPARVEVRHQLEHKNARFVERRVHQILADKRLRGDAHSAMAITRKGNMAALLMFLEYVILDRKLPEKPLPVDSTFLCLTSDRLIDSVNSSF
jgi:hypothetical protein